MLKCWLKYAKDFHHSLIDHSHGYLLVDAPSVPAGPFRWSSVIGESAALSDTISLTL